MTIVALFLAVLPIYFSIRSEAKKVRQEIQALHSLGPHLEIQSLLYRGDDLQIIALNNGDAQTVITEVLVRWEAWSGDQFYEGYFVPLETRAHVVSARGSCVMTVPRDLQFACGEAAKHGRNPGIVIEFINAEGKPAWTQPLSLGPAQEDAMQRLVGNVVGVIK